MNKINYLRIYSTSITAWRRMPIGSTHNSCHNVDFLACLPSKKQILFDRPSEYATYYVFIYTFNEKCVFRVDEQAKKKPLPLHTRYYLLWFGWLQCNVSMEFIHQSHNIHIAQLVTCRRMPHAQFTRNENEITEKSCRQTIRTNARIENQKFNRIWSLI